MSRRPMTDVFHFWRRPQTHRLDARFRVRYLFSHEQIRHTHLSNTLTDTGTDPGSPKSVFTGGKVMTTVSAHAARDFASDLHDYRPRFPFATLKAVGYPVYRSQGARDYACLLDLDPQVLSWKSLTDPLTPVGAGDTHHHVDFEVQTETSILIVDVSDDPVTAPHWIPETLAACGHRYHPVSAADLNPIRVSNARDLVRYARYEASLGDRVRLMAALDEMGSLTLAECMAVVRGGRPMDAVACLILRGHLEVDIDESLLGPGTVVRLGSK